MLEFSKYNVGFPVVDNWNPPKCNLVIACFFINRSNFIKSIYTEINKSNHFKNNKAPINGACNMQRERDSSEGTAL